VADHDITPLPISAWGPVESFGEKKEVLAIAMQPPQCISEYHFLGFQRLMTLGMLSFN
jgi:hypothetical protein